MFSQVTRFHSFKWMNNIPVCVRVCVCVYVSPIFFIHLFLDGHLTCFRILAAVLIILQLTQGCIYLFKLVFLFSSEKYPEVELVIYMGFPCSSVSKESACNAGDPGSIPGLGRSHGQGNGHPLLYSCLKNPRDTGVWWATVYGVARVGCHLATKPPPWYV